MILTKQNKLKNNLQRYFNILSLDEDCGYGRFQVYILDS